MGTARDPGRPGAAPARVPVRTLSLSIAAAMLGYAALAALTGNARAVAALAPRVWLAAFALSLASYLLRFGRWQALLAMLGARIGWRHSLEIYLAAFALTLTPGKAGELVRSVYLAPWGVRYHHSIGAFLAERLLDVAAVGLLSVLALTVFPQHRPWLLAALAACLTLVVALRSRLPRLAARRLARRALLRHAGAALATAGRLLRGRHLAPCAAASVLAWAAQGYALFLVVDALGYPLSPASAIGIYCLSILAGAASMIPGGLGATEAAIALLLAAVGMEPGAAVGAALVSRGVTLWLAVGLGIAAMAKLGLTRKATPA